VTNKFNWIVPMDAKDWRTHVEKLENENENLRAALEEIASLPIHHTQFNLAKIARKALNPDERG